MILCTIKLSVSRDNKGEVMRLLRPLIDPTQSLSGCIDCNLAVDAKDEQMLYFTMSWSNRQDLERYICSDYFLAVLTAMDLCNKAPQVCFQNVSGVQGMEYIRKVRRIVPIMNRKFSVQSLKAALIA